MNEMATHTPPNIRLINPISKRFTPNRRFTSSYLIPRYNTVTDLVVFVWLRVKVTGQGKKVTDAEMSVFAEYFMLCTYLLIITFYLDGRDEIGCSHNNPDCPKMFSVKSENRTLKCFYPIFNIEPISWNLAKKNCEESGGQLAMPKTPEVIISMIRYFIHVILFDHFKCLSIR